MLRKLKHRVRALAILSEVDKTKTYAILLTGMSLNVHIKNNVVAVTSKKATISRFQAFEQNRHFQYYRSAVHNSRWEHHNCRNQPIVKGFSQLKLLSQF